MHITALNLGLLGLGLVLSFVFVWLGFTVPGWGAPMAVTGLLAGLVTLVRPRAGLIILVFTMLLSPAFSLGRLGLRSIEIRFDDIMLLLIFTSWFTIAALKKMPLVGFKVPLIKPMLAYIAVAVVSSLIGLIEGRLGILPVTMYLLKYAQYYMLYYMAYHLIEDFDRSRIFLWAGLITLGAVLVFAYYMMAQGQAPYCPFDIDQGVTETATLGGYLLIACGIMGGIALYHNHARTRLTLLAVLIFCIPPMLATTSRSTYFAAVVMIAAMIALGKGRRVLLLLMGALIALYIAPIFYKDYIKLARARVAFTFVAAGGQEVLRLGGKDVTIESSAAVRLRKWRQLRKDWIPRHPFFGYGVTGVGLCDTQIPLVIGETGLLGFACWVAIMSGLLIRLWRVWRTTEAPLQKGLVFGLLCVYIALLVQSIGVNTFIIIRMMEPFWFLTAIAMRIYSGGVEEGQGKSAGTSAAHISRA
ncbi:MAG: hypothetical protein ABIJ96_15840 [Elusimicrobiota bacterium]